MDYLKFSVEDLASDDYFLRWVNHNDLEAEKFWTLFLETNPEMKLKVEQAKALALNLKHAQHQYHSERQIEGIWEKVGERIDRLEKHRYPKKEKSFVFNPYLVAASLILFALSIAYWYNFSESDRSISNSSITAHFIPSDYIDTVNTSGNALTLRLNEGTVVKLENNSQLRYKKNYEKEEAFRDVYLTGEAFFEVTKNQKQPFQVHSGGVITKVLGTSFRVKAYDDNKKIMVAVKSGKVSVFASKNNDFTSNDIQSEKNGVILLPNQQVIFLRDQESFDKTLVEEPTLLSSSIQARDFTFEDTPIKDVFKLLMEAYGIEIVFDEETVKNCYITAPLGSEPWFDKLRIICRAIGATYEIIDAKVVINSSGC